MTSEVSHPRPPQHDTAEKRARQKCPEAADKIDAILTNADRQIFANLMLYEPPKFPGVKIPITQMAFSFTPEKAEALLESIIEINTSGFEKSQSPLSVENYYERIFAYADRSKETGRAINLTAIFVGQETALGGKSTKDYYRAKQLKGLAVEGQIVASFAEQILSDNPNEREKTIVHFYGKSMGAIKAHEAIREFQPTDVKKEAELIRPPRIPGLPEAYQPNDAQIILGYALQGSIDKKIKKVWQEITRPEYTQELLDAYETNGISTKDTLQQRLLKKKTIALNVKNILYNQIHKQKEFPFPLYVEVGAIDPINASVKGYDHAHDNEIIQEGNLTVVFTLETHSPDKYPVKQWSKAIQGVDIQPL